MLRCMSPFQTSSDRRRRSEYIDSGHRYSSTPAFRLACRRCINGLPRTHRRGGVLRFPATNHRFRFSEEVSSPEIKNISLLQKTNRRHIYCHPVPGRGALAIVANEGRVAVDAEAPLTRGADAYDKGVWS